LVSGSTRGLPHRLEWLNAFVPVGVVEASHFLASVVGVGLLLLARGLRYRLRTAYHVAMILLLTGAILSLLKGLDFEETCLLALTAALLLPVKSHFSRSSKLRDLAFTPAWTISIAIVLVGVFALGLFSYKHVEYSNDLWWRFTLHGNASRFLRAFVGVFATIAGFGAWKLLGPPGSRGAEIPIAPTDFVDLVPIVHADSGTSAHLVLVGDKSVLFHPSRKSFIMFRSQGRSLVCMGDPVGREEDRAELVWMFKAHCDRFASHPVFYQVSPECLPLYIDIGLAFLKLGEEAMVDLGSFDLAGATHKGMRANFRRLARDDVEFSILAPDQVASRMSELRSVSDAWMPSKQAKEKGFSLGFFDEAYLALCPVAIATVQGAIVAFANLWEAGDRQELSVDLMRYAPSAPKGVMDFLFASILEHGRDQGWKRFNLGMAPLSGLEGRRLAPHWSKAGHFLFSHGEGLYNFRGLRHYKEKFHPAWEPRYLAYPGGLTLPGVLANLALLISRGSNR
jgi:phosphatidylglycerol lysyltransferase